MCLNDLWDRSGHDDASSFENREVRRIEWFLRLKCPTDEAMDRKPRGIRDTAVVLYTLGNDRERERERNVGERQERLWVDVGERGEMRSRGRVAVFSSS